MVTPEGLELYTKAQKAKKKGYKIRCLDKEKLKKVVESKQDQIECVKVGIEEDFPNTKGIFYEDSTKTFDMDTGCTCSIWGTPIAYIFYKDGITLGTISDYYEKEYDD